ncbi:hypothetical protein FOA43_004347 [Brettanomyces nanus]|uniref:Nucleolar protein 16 n=1 Tax=Eeniella nana TaxID=13502 RepID=A0A875S7S0_EENNA|nr:uncharacterized protein FOA43_004347 [Brettanomyces nanus]QPG76953.1 hypothetical protein FOA43_004347 [Brettanomyces nanus]
MVSVRRRRAQKSSVRKVSRKSKDKFRKVSNFGNPVIAAHWDQKLTLSQNYAKLGLKYKLGRKAGGSEKKVKIIKPIKVDDDGEDLDGAQDLDMDEEEDELKRPEDDPNFDPYDPANILEGTAKIIKDKDGKTEKIIFGTKKLNKDKDEEEEDKEEEDSQIEKTNMIIEQLEARSHKAKKERKMNEFDMEFLNRLNAKYGDDYEAMKWDKKLNPFQLSPGDLKKRFRSWCKQNQSEEYEEEDSVYADALDS